MGIDQFMGRNRGAQSKAAQFADISKGKNKEDVRKLEQQMLKPAALPPFARKQSASGGLADRSLKIIFPDLESMELFGKHFRIGRYIENSVTDITLLNLFIDALEREEIVYDKDAGTLRYTGVEQRNSDRVAPVDGGEQRTRTRRR